MEYTRPKRFLKVTKQVLLDLVKMLKVFKENSDLLEARNHPTKHLRLPACQELHDLCAVNRSSVHLFGRIFYGYRPVVVHFTVFHLQMSKLKKIEIKFVHFQCFKGHKFKQICVIDLKLLAFHL